jgi:pimeloyl-ACP methyl ester carboxylesterase
VHIAHATEGQGPVDVAVILGWAMPFEALGWSPYLRALRDGLASVGRLVLFDKRGTGLSDRDAKIPTLEERSSDLMTVLDAVGSRRVLVVGVSEGGPLALQIAARHARRVTGLLLIGAFARMARADDHPEGWSDAAVAKLRRYIETRWGSGATAAAAIPSLSGEVGFGELCARIERSGASPGAALQLLETNLATDVRSLLESVRVPTTVLHSKDDQVIGYDHGAGLASRIPGAKFVTLRGGDHLPVREVTTVIEAARQLQRRARG